jgi:uncharacterized damage-inducible protein DinB
MVPTALGEAAVNAEDVRTLLDYHYWARDRVLDAVEPLSPEQVTGTMGGSFRSIRDTLVHVYWAEWLWYWRWQGQPKTIRFDQVVNEFPDVASLRKAWREHEQLMRAFFDALDGDGIKRVIEYKSLAGQPAASILWHMLQHVVNHASYHRGQVTTLLRQIGAAPPKSMDLIAFYRERSASAV